MTDWKPRTWEEAIRDELLTWLLDSETTTVEEDIRETKRETQEESNQ